MSLISFVRLCVFAYLLHLLSRNHTLCACWFWIRASQSDNPYSWERTWIWQILIEAWVWWLCEIHRSCIVCPHRPVPCNPFTGRLLRSQLLHIPAAELASHSISYWPHLLPSTFPGTLWTIRPWSTVKFFKLVSMRDRTPYHKADWLATDLPGFSAIDLAGSLLSDDRDDKSMPT